MKRLIVLCNFLWMIFLLVNISCQKELQANNGSPTPTSVPVTPGLPAPNNPTPNNPTPPYAEPSVRSGIDKLVFLPENASILSGWVSYNGSLPRVLWTKISGPQSFLIEHTDSLRTKISNLEKGIYEFEITGFGSGTYTSKDTCKVIVNQLYNTGEVVFSNQHWVQAPGWGSQNNNPGIYQYMPTGVVFKIYIKRDNSSSWEELIYGVEFGNYSVGIEDGTFSIFFSLDQTDTPDIKLVF